MSLIFFKGIGLVELVTALTAFGCQLHGSLHDQYQTLSLSQRVQSCQVQRDGSPVGSFWSSNNDGFLCWHIGTIQLLFDVWGGLKGGIVYVLPLRVEPHIGKTHVWPAAGELVSLYHCANLAWGTGLGWVAGRVLEGHMTDVALSMRRLGQILQKSADTGHCVQSGCRSWKKFN